MNRRVPSKSRFCRQAGLTLVELMISITISLVVLSGVVQALVVSKSNFITQREMATLQENARFALKYLTDEIRMAGYSGCSAPLKISNTINNSSTTWYLSLGMQGYEYDAGINTFPADFRAAVRANTDAISIGRGKTTGLLVTGHNGNSAQISLSGTHSYKPGQVMLMADPDCEHVGIFQMSGPTNNSNNANNIVHNTGNSITPGNCSKDLASTGTISTCASPSYTPFSYTAGATLTEMHSEAYYVGSSQSDATVPALFRQKMVLDTSTSTPYTLAEELVQGIDNMQLLYGLDTDGDPLGLADRYMKANAITGVAPLLWSNVVSVRLTIRMRSITPVYNNNETYAVFEGVTGTDGSDRYMRQTISSTITLRNP